jgi:hypothetical protein
LVIFFIFSRKYFKLFNLILSQSLTTLLVLFYFWLIT